MSTLPVETRSRNMFRGFYGQETLPIPPALAGIETVVPGLMHMMRETQDVIGDFITTTAGRAIEGMGRVVDTTYQAVSEHVAALLLQERFGTPQSDLAWPVAIQLLRDKLDAQLVAGVSTEELSNKLDSLMSDVVWSILEKLQIKFEQLQAERAGYLATRGAISQEATHNFSSVEVLKRSSENRVDTRLAWFNQQIDTVRSLLGFWQGKLADMLASQVAVARLGQASAVS